MLAAVALAISIGIASGLTRRAPFSFCISHCASRVCRPPMPVATATPSRSRATGLSSLQPEAGVAPGLHRRDDAELRAAVEPAGLDAFEHLGGLHRGLRRDLYRQIIGPIRLDPATPDVRREVLPRAGGVAPQRGGGSDAGDDDADAGHWVTPALACRVVWLISGPPWYWMALGDHGLLIRRQHARCRRRHRPRS